MRRFPPPILRPPRNHLPILLSVPHSGRDYDPLIIANAAQGERALAALEDPLVDRLCWRATAAGFATLIQPVPRAVIDCNRSEEEVDPAAIADISPAPVGPRARHGLGIIPSRTGRHGTLWRRRIDREEFRLRLDEVHRPYHQAACDLLETMVEQSGAAVLLDCHSMPPRPEADLVIGDRHGTTAAPWVSALAARMAREAGFSVAMNRPYAGGAIVAAHGQPKRGIHALQLEFSRATYLLGDGRTPSAGFDRVADFIATLARDLGEAARVAAIDEAAE